MVVKTHTSTAMPGLNGGGGVGGGVSPLSASYVRNNRRRVRRRVKEEGGMSIMSGLVEEGEGEAGALIFNHVEWTGEAIFILGEILW